MMTPWSCNMTWTAPCIHLIKTVPRSARHPRLNLVPHLSLRYMASSSNTRRNYSRRDDPPQNVVWPAEQRLLVVDLEATCWETKPPPNQFHEIIEIGWALVDLESTPPCHVSSGTVLVKPTRSDVSPFCTQLTTITADLLDAEGVSLQEAFETLVNDVGSKNYSWSRYICAICQVYADIWSSWGAYDLNMVKRQCKIFGLESPFANTHYNIKDLFKVLYPNLRGGYGMTNAFAAVCDGPIEGTHHRGGDDAKNIGCVSHFILE